MYAPLIANYLQESGQGAVLAHLNNCLPTPDINISTACMSQAADNVSAVRTLPRVRVVILATTWPLTDTLYTASGVVPKSEASSLLSNSLDRLIDLFLRDGKSVVLIGPLAVPDYDAASVVGREMAYGRKVTEPLFRPEDTYVAEYGEILAHFSARPDITFIRPDRVQCVQGRCDFFRDNVPLFADSNHLAQSSLYLFRPVFGPAIRHVLMGMRLRSDN
jgi:hypothetical protein